MPPDRTLFFKQLRAERSMSDDPRAQPKVKRKGGAPAIYPFGDLEVDDQFVVTVAEYQERNGTDAHIGKLEASLRLCARRHRPKQFSFKTTLNACVVTRKL
jgi:hypothetical protein